MRFNGYLLLLLALTGVSALFMPPGVGDSFRKLSVLLLPVSYPVRLIAGNVDARIVRQPMTPSQEKESGRSPSQLLNDNDTLKYQLSVLTSENELLHRQLSEVRSLNLKSQVKVVPVIGGDFGSRQMLTLQLSSGEGVVPNIPVTYVAGGKRCLAGRVEVSGLGAANVLLVTDPQSTITGVFRRYQKDVGLVTLPQSPKTIVGKGAGKMMIASVKKEEAIPEKQPDAALAVGDWFVVADKDLPADVQGYKIGEIESINQEKRPLFIDIALRADVDLMKLREVLVPLKK